MPEIPELFRNANSDAVQMLTPACYVAVRRVNESGHVMKHAFTCGFTGAGGATALRTQEHARHG